MIPNYYKPGGRLLAFILCCLILKANAQVRPVESLIYPGDSGWVLVQDWIRVATNKVEVLPCDSLKASDVLYEVQVTTRSPMGGVIFKTGGLLIDHGWIRILGAGSKRLNRCMPDWNRGKTFNEYGEHTPFYLVADDVLGGFFAINGGALGEDVGKMYYLAPDNLKWEPMHYSYSDFLRFCFVGDLDAFYKGYRWNNWQAEVDTLSGEKGFSFYPFLWSKEGVDISKDTRKAVPIEELYIATMDFRKQMGFGPAK